jgi:hypoxanthine phosphoribosyltransferase
MGTLIHIRDKKFKPFISEEKISEAVKRIASRINSELKDEQPVFLAVLNGSFMFASDLMKQIDILCEISFVKVASYQGATSSGTVTELIGLTEDLTGRTVVIVEDIVDSGLTVSKVQEVLAKKHVRNVKVATALLKPGSLMKDVKVDYVGFSIGNDFVVGYGLDYKGFGRNLREIHVLA